MTRLLLSAAAALALAGAPAAAQTQGVSDSEVVIGSVNDLSGPFAAFGAPAVKAAQLYFDDINAKGGVHGRKIRFVVEDHGYQVPKAVQAVNKLVNRDKVFAMLLSLGTPHNIAAFKVLDRKGIPNISPLSAARQMVQEPMRNKFAGLASYYDGMRAGTRYLVQNEGVKRICAMYLPTDFGREVVDGARDEAAAEGLEFVAETTHKPDEVDFVGALGKLREAECDMIAIALGLRQVIAAVATAKKIGWNDVKFLGSSAAFHTVIAKVPGGVTDGMYAAAAWQDIEARLSNPTVAAWVKSYTEATGEKLPGTGALLGRAAAEGFVRALEKAGPDLTTDSFIAAMESLDYQDEIQGTRIDYSPTDHVGGEEVFISRIEGGSWKLLGSVKAGS